MANNVRFPAGADPADIRVPVATDLRPEISAKVAHGVTPARARDWRWLRCARPLRKRAVVGERRIACRTRAPAWKPSSTRSRPADRFDFIARAITLPNRRDASMRFFMADADAIAHVLDAASNEEPLTPAWLTLAKHARSIFRHHPPVLTGRSADIRWLRWISAGAFFRFTREPQLAHL
jgi:hypothetical protein